MSAKFEDMKQPGRFMPGIRSDLGIFDRERTRMSAKFEGMKQPGENMRGNSSAFQISRSFAFFRGSNFCAKFGGRPDSR